MDNLMRDKFIELVHDLLWDDEDPQRANMIIDCADEYAESMKSQWIPVSEKLPEKRGFYLVTEKEYRIGDKNHLGKFETKVNFVEFEKKWNRASFFEITAWMPKPEPYHGVNKNE